MNRIRTVFAATLLLLAACATQPTQSALANIPQPPFVVLARNATVDTHYIRDRMWQPDHSILLRTYHGDWYHLVLTGGCTHAFATAGIGFISRGGTLVDRSSSIVVDGQACPIASIDQIQPPAPAPT